MLRLRSVLRLHPLIVANHTHRHLLHTLAQPGHFSRGALLATLKPCQAIATRQYAKKNKAATKAQGQGKRVTSYKLRDEQLRELVDIDKYLAKMELVIGGFQESCIQQLSLRSTVGSIETVIVKTDGQKHHLQDIAQISRKNPKTISINMSEFPDKIKPAMKALTQSGLNINPQQDGTFIFVPVAKVTKDHRTTLAKNAKALFVKCREQIRSVQSEFIRKVQNNTQISSDDNIAARNQLTDMGDEYVAKAENILKVKEKELLNN